MQTVNAYERDCSEAESFEKWIERRCNESAQFKYWNTTIELEGMLLNFVRTLRESDFSLYVQVLEEICPWLFALDLVHYARWLLVFVKTMIELPVRHRHIYDAFL